MKKKAIVCLLFFPYSTSENISSSSVQRIKPYKIIGRIARHQGLNFWIKIIQKLNRNSTNASDMMWSVYDCCRDIIRTQQIGKI